MKLFVSCDMEGVSGVTGSEDVDPGKPAYERFRRLMTGDVNAAVEGAVLAGADEVLVNDSHDGMRNILIEELNPKAKLISGDPKPLGMMEGIDESFDLAIFLAYHAMAGTAAAILDHTWSSRMVSDVWVNDRLVGETGINAGVAGYFGVPVGAVSGDDKLAKEATGLLGNIEVAVVKEGIDRYVARCLALAESRERIRAAAKRAVERRGELKPFTHTSPATFKIRFTSTTEASTACHLPMVRRVDGRTISFGLDDYLDTFRMLDAVLDVASAGHENGWG